MRRYNLCVWVCLVGILVPVAGKAAGKLEITEEQRRGAALLQSAMNASDRAAYTATVKAPFKDWPEITEARFFRRPRTSEEGVDLRLELYKGQQCFAVLIQNRDGQFALSGDGKIAVRGGEFTSLFHLEHLFAEFYHSEMEYNQYRIADAGYQGTPCYLVTVTVPESIQNDFPALCGLTGVFPLESQRFRKLHPFVREFLIGRDNKVIYSRKHYNGRKKLIYSASLGNVTFKPDWEKFPGIFDTPANICREVSQECFFYVLLQWDQHIKQSNPVQPRQPFWPRVADYLLAPTVIDTVSWILGLTGGLFLIFAFLYRRGWFASKH